MRFRQSFVGNAPDSFLPLDARPYGLIADAGMGMDYRLSVDGTGVYQRALDLCQGLTQALFWRTRVSARCHDALDLYKVSGRQFEAYFASYHQIRALYLPCLTTIP